MTPRWLGLLGGAALLALVAASCGPRPEEAKMQPAEGGVLLQGAGATFPKLIYKAWFSAYYAKDNKVAVDYDAIGSGGGVRRFIAGDVDFGASDAAMNDAELAKVDGQALMVPMCAGSVVIVYNLPGLTKPLQLSREAYVAIFLGKVNKWNDPLIAACNPGVELPGTPVAVCTRFDSSGTTFTFTNHLAAISAEWRDGPGAAKALDWPGRAMNASGNSGVAALVKRTPGGVGYVMYGFARKLKLSMASLENQAGNYVAPTADSGVATLAAVELPDNLRAFFPDPKGEQAYPIVTFTWLLLYPGYDEQKLAGLKKLLGWCLGDEGQAMCREHGYIPLAEPVRQRSLAALESLQTK